MTKTNVSAQNVSRNDFQSTNYEKIDNSLSNKNTSLGAKKCQKNLISACFVQQSDL